MKDALAVIAGILAIIAAIPYLVDIVKGRTKPNVVSWSTWTLLLIIATAGAFAAHETRSALLTLGDTIGTGLTLILGMKFGIAKFSWFDATCQIGATTGLILWLIFNSPSIAILFVVVIDLLGCLPTIKHSWQDPSEETWQTFAVVSLASTITLFSLSNYTFAGIAYPIYLLAANFTIMAVVVFRRRQMGISLARHSIHETLHE